MSIYLDNAATTFPKPEQVYMSVLDSMKKVGASSGRGGYGRSLDASRIIMETRQIVARFINCQDSSRIIFTANATAALNLAVAGTLKSGDHVITSSMEHNSLLRPLFMLEKQGINLTVVSADTNGMIDPEDIRLAVKASTRMIAVSHVSNVTGNIQDINRIADIAHSADALMLLDAAQSAGSIPIDMHNMGIDLLACPGHKGLLGPQGTGFLAVAQNIDLRPVMAGGTGSSSDSNQQPETFPDGFEVGTHNLPGIAGLGAGIGFVESHGVASIGKHEHWLAEELRGRLVCLPGAKVYGAPEADNRSGVVSMTLEGSDPALLAFALDREYGIAVRAGLHCAPHAHRTIGSYPLGTVRMSPGWFNTLEDIENCYEAFASIIRKGH